MTRETDTSKSTASRRGVLIAVAAVLGCLALAVTVWALVALTFPKPPAETPVQPVTAASPADAPTGANVEASASVAGTAVSNAATATAVAKSSLAAPAPPAAEAAVPARPLGMAYTLAGSRQMAVATGDALGATTGTLRVFNLDGGVWREVFSAPCRFGTNGLIDGTARKEGSRTTPTGIWWPGTFVWGWHATPPSGTKMPYRQTTANVWWSAVRDRTYNTWVVSSKRVSGEHLVNVRVQYEYAWSTGYNAPPNQAVKGRGTAIFLHVFDPPDYNHGLTAGCIAVSRDDMVRVFRILDPARKPTFAVGTEQPGTPTSISAY